MTIASADRGKPLRTGAPGGWMRTIFARFKRPAGLKGTDRAEFELIARDLDLSPPELYGLLTGNVLSDDELETRLAELELSPERIKARIKSQKEHMPAKTQAFLPIGPCCC